MCTLCRLLLQNARPVNDTVKEILIINKYGNFVLPLSICANTTLFVVAFRLKEFRIRDCTGSLWCTRKTWRATVQNQHMLNRDSGMARLRLLYRASTSTDSTAATVARMVSIYIQVVIQKYSRKWLGCPLIWGTTCLRQPPFYDDKNSSCT